MADRRRHSGSIAGRGQVWVCAACGKTARNAMPGSSGNDHGWDESCMMHAVLCYSEKNDDGVWVAVPPEEGQ